MDAHPWWMLFVFGSVWFWALLVVVNIILFACIENTRGFLASFMTLITLCLIQFLGDIPVFPTIFNDPWGFIMWAAVYLGVGTVLSISWFFIYCRRQRRIYDERKEKFCVKHNLQYDAPIPPNFVVRWEKQTYDLETPRPFASKHKEHIYMWIAFWPWRLLWAFLSDFITGVCRRIYESIAGILNSISAYWFAGVEQDFVKPVNPNAEHPEE